MKEKVYACEMCGFASIRRSNFRMVTIAGKSVMSCGMCHKYQSITDEFACKKSISKETIEEIDRMHVIDAIKVRLEDAITYLIPVALTPEEAQLVLVEMGPTIKDIV